MQEAPLSESPGFPLSDGDKSYFKLFESCLRLSFDSGIAYYCVELMLLLMDFYDLRLAFPGAILGYPLQEVLK